MDNRVLDFNNRLQSYTKRVITLFQGMPAEKLFYKPSPDVWSIAENIEHIIILN